MTSKAASLKQKLTISSFLQRYPDFHTGKIIRTVCFAVLLLFTTAFHSGAQIIRKSKVTFLSSDSLTITADQYFSKNTNPWILLFHTENASRGEFDTIAVRFGRMQYNCLAVDLRSGNTYNYVENETAKKALELDYSTSLIQASRDVGSGHRICI